MNHQYAHPADLTPAKPAALHVDQAMGDLVEAVASNAEVVRALLRRIEPLLAKPAIITGSLGIHGADGAPLSGFVLAAGKAPLAAAIEGQVASLSALAKEVGDALDALQI